MVGYEDVRLDEAGRRHGLGGAAQLDVRADLTYRALPNGGAVFFVGSINRIGSLTHNGCANNAVRITATCPRTGRGNRGTGTVKADGGKMAAPDPPPTIPAAAPTVKINPAVLEVRDPWLRS
jgi:hypothetical protein